MARNIVTIILVLIIGLAVLGMLIWMIIKSAKEHFKSIKKVNKPWAKQEIDQLHTLIKCIIQQRMNQAVKSSYCSSGLLFGDIVEKDIDHIVDCITSKAINKYSYTDLYGTIIGLAHNRQFLNFVDGIQGQCGLDRALKVADYIAAFLESCGMTCDFPSKRATAQCIHDHYDPRQPSEALSRCTSRNCPLCYYPTTIYA